MRVLHTSDWHIGRRFKGLDQIEWQRRALDWLCGLIDREHVDVLVVAGDVYDQPRPGATAVKLLDDVLGRLARIEVNGHPLHIIYTPGNHDSADRLGFGADLMMPNIHIRHRIDDIATPVLLDLGGDRLAVYALPYLDPDVARPFIQSLANLPEPPARSHAAVMGEALKLVEADLRTRRADDPGLASMLIAHAFVGGSAPSDSERTIAVGGVDNVPASLFSNSGLDYLALGHLHRPQRVNVPAAADGGRTPVARYSGSLLAYSFSEAPAKPTPGNGKSVVLLDIDSDGVHDLRTVPVESGQPAFVRLEGTLKELTGPMADEHQDDWVSLTINYTEYPRGMFQQLDARYPHALEKHPHCLTPSPNHERTMVDLRTVHDEMEVLVGFVTAMRGTPPSDAERDVLEHSVERVRAQRHDTQDVRSDDLAAAPQDGDVSDMTVQEA